MAQNIVAATDGNFEAEVIQSKQLTLVDFWAEWCGPCKQLGPTIEQIATEYSEQLKVLKMNVDENPGTPTRFNIRGIPTVIFFKDGQVVDQLVGNLPKSSYEQAIKKHL